MKLKHILLTTVFLPFLFAPSFYSIMTPDREISELENRGLAQIPGLTKNSVLSGEYFKEYEAYFTDQFFKRDKWVEFYTIWEMKMNKTFVNGYHVTIDNWIMPQPSNSFYKEELETSASSLNELGTMLHAKGTELYYFPMPAKVFEMAELLPPYVPRGRGKESTDVLLSMLDDKVVHGVNVSKKLNEEVPFAEKKSYYFKTDHHWNIKGAFFGFETMIEEISKTQPIKSKLNVEEEYNYSCEEGRELLGSWNRNLHMLVSAEDDNPCYFKPKNFSLADMDYYNGVISEEKTMEFTDYYATGIQKDLQTMEYHDAYANNYAELNIVNKAANNEVKALLIKDSYANPLVPHISSLFKETTIFDPRYDKKSSVIDLVNEREFDVVIVLYNSNNLIGAMYDFRQRAE
ncbi:MAG: alginate O-acetyltransferase AlgX-related protein [Bacillota bacterium]